MSQLERNGTSNEVTQIKKFIGQYCVCNIISLQDITLQIPIVTKSSILSVGKVSQVWFCFLIKKQHNFQKARAKLPKISFETCS